MLLLSCKSVLSLQSMCAATVQRVRLSRRHNAACKIAPVPSKDCIITALDKHCKEELPKTDANCQWAHLPVIELVFQHLMQESSARDTKDMFSACGVCSCWRAAGQAVFFSNSWQRSSGIITHPFQLYSLCPLTHARGGHIKCFVIRESNSSSSRIRRSSFIKYLLYQGHEYNNRASAKCLLSAVQERGKRKFTIYLTHNCTGKPVAQLSGNVMGTSYSLTSYICSTSSSTSSAKYQARSSAPEVLQVSYKLRVRGMMLPRRMSVALSCPHHHRQQQQQLQLHRSGSSGSSTDCEITIVGEDHADAAKLHLGQLVPRRRRSSSSRSCSVTGKAHRCGSARSDVVHNQQQQQQTLLHHLHNKAPHWNEALRCWCLNFRGRVKLASVKNFQLIRDHTTAEQQQQHLLLNTTTNSSTSSSSHAGLSPAGSSDIGSISSSSSSSTISTMSESLQEQQHCRPLAAYTAAAATAAARAPGSPHTYGIITQFGKVEDNTFILDYDPVLVNAVQAFAVALTTFGAKILL